MLDRLDNLPDVLSNNVGLTAMINSGIISVDDSSFVLNIGINQIEEPDLLLATGANVSRVTYQIGTYLGLGFFLSVSCYYTRIFDEKEAKLLSVLRDSGLYESAHFCALWTIWLGISFFSSIFTLVAGLIVKNVVVINSNYILQHGILWTTSVCMGTLFLFLSALITNRNVGVFISFLLGVWAMTPTALLAAKKEFDIEIINAGSVFTWTNPWCHLAALYVNICSYIDNNPGKSFTWNNWDWLSSLIYFIDMGEIVLFLTFAFWGSSVREAGEGFFFFLNPYYWGIGKKQRRELLNDTVARKQKDSLENGSIQLHKLSKVFDSEKAVKQLSVEFLEGETTVLLGNSGAGKTTVLNMLAGKYAPSDGCAFVKGFDLSVDSNKIQKSVGICPQESILWEELTARQHLELYATFRGIPEEEREIIISKKLKDFNFGYIYSVPTPVGNFSRGMKRILQLALASIGEPAVLLLDEPTTGMDPMQMRFTWKVINHWKKNAVVLLATNNMEEADTLGDKIGIMTYGKLEEFGDAKLLKHRFGCTTISMLYDMKQVEDLEIAIIEVAPGSKLRFAGNSLHVDLPQYYTSDKSRMLKVIKFLESSEIITEWSMNNGTLEQAFLKVDEFNKATEETDQKCSTCGELKMSDTKFDSKDVCLECGKGVSLDSKQLILDENPSAQTQPGDLRKPSVELVSLDQKDLDAKEEKNPSVARAKKAIACSKVPTVSTFGSQLKGIFLKDFYIESSYIKTTFLCACLLVTCVLSVIFYQMSLPKQADDGWEKDFEKCGKSGWYDLIYPGSCEDRIERYEQQWKNASAPYSNALLCTQYYTENGTEHCNLTSLTSYPRYSVPQDSKQEGVYHRGVFNETNIWFRNSLIPGDDLLEDPSADVLFFSKEFANLVDKTSVIGSNTSMSELISQNMENHLSGGTLLDQNSPCASPNNYGNYSDLKVRNFTTLPLAYNYFVSQFPDYGFSINRLNGNESILDFNITTYHWSRVSKPATITTFTKYPSYQNWYSGCLSLRIADKYSGGEYRSRYSAYSQIITQLTNSYLSLAQNKYGKTLPYDMIQANFIPVQHFVFLWISPNVVFIGVTLFFTMLRMPSHIARIISEREKSLLHLLKCNGLGVSIYFAGEYLYMLVTDLIFNTVYLIMLVLARIDPLRRNGGWVFLLVIIWSHCQAGLCFLLASMFSRSQNSVIVTFTVVIVNAVFATSYYVSTESFMNPAVYLVPFAAYDDGLVMISTNRLELLALPMIFLFISGFLFLCLGAWVNLLREFTLAQLFWLIYGYFCDIEDVDAEKMESLKNQEEYPNVVTERKRVSDSRVGDYRIRVLNGTKIFPQNKIACQDVTVGVRPGEIVSLLGPNEAGKSTLLYMLSGLYAPTSGICEITGHNVVKSRAEVFKNLGICPQEDLYWDELSVEQHFTMFANIRGVDERHIQDLVHAIAELVELDGDAFTMPAANLSGGQKKRLSIGISLMGNPSVWLLDEPSTGLDPGTKKIIWDIVLSQQGVGRSVVLTTHSIEEADALSDRICIMARGKMKTIGTPAYLKKSYGQGNIINLQVFPDFELERYVEFLSTEFKEQVKVGFFVGHKCQLVVPSSVRASLIHEVVETHKSRFLIQEWSFEHASIVLMLSRRFDGRFYSDS